MALALAASRTATAGRYEQGQAAAQAGDYAGAARLWRPLAAAGRPEAQYNLGVLYDRGLGVPRNAQTAAAWYRKAAENGVIDAQVNLAILYANGDGVPKDKTLAAKWFGRAARLGNSEAQFNLDLLQGPGGHATAAPSAAPSPGPAAAAGPIELPATPSREGSLWVQVGAFQSVAAAHQEWVSLRRNLPAQTEGRSEDVEPFRRGTATMQRALVGPFGDEADAHAFCRSLQVIGNVCLVRTGATN